MTLVHPFKVIVFCLLASLTLAQQAPGTIVALSEPERVMPEQISQLAAPLFSQYGVPRLTAAVDRYELRYLTTDLDGSLTEIVAQLFVPVYTVPAERPLYVFGSGTTGLAEACAPSVEYDYDHPLGHYRANMLAYASRGFIGIFPDYLGFNDAARPQAYFSALAEGRVMLDAIRATTAFFAANPQAVALSGDVFTAGYSQGGHAAFAAADLRPSYAPEVPLNGMIGYGATTNVERLLKEGPYYAPYIARSYNEIYGEAFDPELVLAAEWVPTLDAAAGSLCVDKAQTYYPFDAERIYNPSFRQALYGGTLATDFPSINDILEQNRTGLSGHGLPALIVQGGNDIIVRDPTQERFVAELCEANSAVVYLNFPEARHRFTRQAGFEESIAWMEGIARGEAPASVCSVLE